jgi:hypothetical protein
MSWRSLSGALLLLGLVGCAPGIPTLVLPKHCPAERSTEQLLAGDWLQQHDVWRLRQGTLLEFGRRKLPLDGFLRLDLAGHEAQLVAMNELGVVLFDLRVGETDEELLRSLPQLRRYPQLTNAVAQGLRRLLLTPRPELGDEPVAGDSRQLLSRPRVDGELSFLYDCQGDLRQIRATGSADDWQAVYADYRELDGRRLPQTLVSFDAAQRVKLTLTLQEARREP